MAARGNARPGAERSCRAVCLSRLIDRRLIGNLGQAHRSAAAKRWLSRDWPTVTPIQVGAPWARPERTRTPRCRSTAHTWSASRRTSANRKFPSLGADRMPSPASAARSRARSVTVARPRSRYQPRAKVLGRGAHVGHRRPSVQRHTRDDEQGNQQEDVHARGRPGGRGEPGPQAEGQEVDGEDRDEEDGLQGPPLPSRSCRRIVRQNRPPAWSRPRRGGPGAALPARRRAAGSPHGPGTPDHEFAPGFLGSWMEGGAYGARVLRAQASGAPSHRPACGAQASVSPAPWTIARRLARLTRDDHETGSEGCYRKSVARLTIRVDLGKGGALGPGKIRLLELIDARGSISEAGRAMGMSYRRAWLLVENLNRSFRDSAVAKQTGGPQGGGARLTPWGRRLVERYRAIETDAAQAVAPHLRVLASAGSGRRLGTPRRLAPSARRSRRPRPATR